MALVKAKVVDSTHLELSDPLEGPRGRTVFVSVIESEVDGDRWMWLEASGESLRAAYGDSEPDYQLSGVKEHNPDFVG